MQYFLYSKAEKHRKDMPVIDEFPFIWEFGHEKYVNIKPSSLSLHYNKGIEVCFIKKGRYNWWVEEQEHSVYPGDGFITCPWQFHGNKNEVVDLGEIYWLIIKPEIFTPEDGFWLGEWSSFSEKENETISRVLADNTSPILRKASILERYFNQLNDELVNRGFGSAVKIKALIEGLILEVVRNIKNRTLEDQMESNWLMKFDQFLQTDIATNWSLEEMSSHFEMGTTSFNDKVKRLTGFSPQSYLIHLRVDHAKNELTKTDDPLTEIALRNGFYSSQHFSSTFLKRVGMTPSTFRKKYKK